MAELDVELQAMQAVIDALDPLDQDARDRVIHYAFDRLGISSEGNAPSRKVPPPETPGVGGGEEKGNVVDVRTLRDEKKPRSANEMAAIVGYYLAELAPPAERKAEITTEDIETLFKQARYPLPKAPRMTLTNATAAGYFESMGGGNYKLNPVGHNLVAHTLPRKESDARSRRRSTATRAKGSAKNKTSSSQAAKKTRSSS